MVRVGWLALLLVVVTQASPALAAGKHKAALAALRAAKVKSPKVIARGQALLVASGKRDGEAVVLAVTTPPGGPLVVLELPMMVFDKTSATITPFGTLWQVDVTTSWRRRLKPGVKRTGMHIPDAKEEGSEGTWYHLVRAAPGELACSFQGDFRHWGPYPGSHRRTVQLRPTSDGLELFFEEDHREHEGQREKGVLHIVLPETGPCQKNKPAGPIEAPPTRAILASTLRQRMPHLRGCPGAAQATGAVKAKLTIQPTGAVTDITLDAHTGTPLGDCLIKTLGDTRFKPFRGNALKVTFPIPLP